MFGRRVISAAPGVVSFSVILAVGADAGGYFPTAWRLSAFALLAFAAAALIARPRVGIDTLDWCLLGAFGALTAWIAASALWSDDPSASLLEAERALVYLAGLVAVVAVAERTTVVSLVIGIVAAVTLVSAYALALHVFAADVIDPVEGRLLYRPIGYANALGILIAMAIALTAGLAFAARRRMTRALALLPLVVLSPSLYLTASRGGWFALVVGLAFSLWCFQRKVTWKLVVPVLSLLCIVAVVVVARSENGISLGDENRPRYWHVALEDAAANPVVGSGAGTFAGYWLAHRSADFFARDAHSLYVESLAELGPLGLLLVVGSLGIPFLALRRGGGPLLASIAGAYVAFVVHAGIDWDWEVPAVTLTGVFCGAALLVGSRSDRGDATPDMARWALVAGILLLAAVTAVRARTGGGYPF